MRTPCWVLCSLLFAAGCNGGGSASLPTAPTSSSNTNATAAATYSIAGSIYTFGGPPPTQITVFAAGGPETTVTAEGQFGLKNVPVSAGQLRLRIDDREFDVGVTPPTTGDSRLQVDISVDLSVGRATVTRSCTSNSAWLNEEIAYVVSLCMTGPA